MEAEVSDLPAYDNNGEPKGAGLENIYSLLNALLRCNTQSRLIEQMSYEQTTDPVIQKTLIANLKQDVILTERFIKDIDIQCDKE